PGESILPSLARKNAHYDNEDRKSSGAPWNSTKRQLEAGGCQRREAKLIKIQDSNGFPHHVQQWEPISQPTKRGMSRQCDKQEETGDCQYKPAPDSGHSQSKARADQSGDCH